MYSIVVVKATRKPYSCGREMPRMVAVKEASQLYENAKLLEAAGVLTNGVSIQVFEAQDAKEVVSLGMGAAAFGRSVYQCGGF